jgi:hypothetical protein
MADNTYMPKVYRKQGGDVLVIAAGGQILAEPGGSIMAGNPTGAADYFVDLNVSATGSGSMQDPFATIAEAITASNTSIGLTANRWWARRNRIFVMGDGIDEDLTVLPEKCDIIGCGSDLVPYPRIIGAHTIAAAKVGCRFINIGFQLTGTGVGLTIPAGCHGFQIIGGMLQPALAGNTVGIQITDSALFKILGLEIHQNPGAYGTGICAVGIAVAGTAATHQFEIAGGFIEATEGIDVVASSPAYGSRIRDLIIKATALAIDENSDTVIIDSVHMYSAANATENGSGVIDANTSLGSNCRITCGDHLNAPWPLQGTLAD